MKNATQKLGKLATLILSLFLIIASCSKDDEPEKKDNPTPGNPDGVVQDSVPPVDDTNVADPNLITQSLILDNMKIIEGELPKGGSTAKLMPADLKIDSDTIFWAPGVVKRIKIKSPQHVIITGAWFYVPGADSYIEASVREEESTDEISILYFEFDPTNWDLPLSYPIKIIPLGPGGEPLIDPDATPGGPVVVEKPHDLTTGSCDWTIGSNGQIWRLQSIKDTLSGLGALAFEPIFTESSTFGSCDTGGLGPCEQGLDDQSVELKYTSYSYIGDVYFRVASEGSYVAWEDTRYVNLDICNSSFCGNTPTAAYNSHQTLVSGFGNWSLRADCTLQLNAEEIDYDYDGDGIITSPKIGSGTRVRFNKTSDHFLVETRTINPEFPDIPSTLVKKYELVSNSIVNADLNPDDDLFWFDLVDPVSDNSRR